MTAKKTAKKEVSKTGGALLMGAAAAAAAASAFYFYGPKGKQHRKKIQSWTLKAQGEVMERIEKLKEIDKSSVDKIVDSVADKYKKAKGVAASEVASFAKDVKEQWNHVEKEFEKGAKKGKAAVKKAAKKTTRKTK